MDWIFCVAPAPLKKSYIDILIPKVFILGGMVFGRWLGYEGGALMNGVGAL